MSEFKIDKLGFYKRRDGKKARVVCVDAGDIWPVIALDDQGHPYMCEANGEAGGSLNNVRSLIAPWTDPEIGSLEWVRTLPPETKVWHATMPSDGFAYPKHLTDKAPPSGWFIIGTAEWANALPSRTKIRHVGWARALWRMFDGVKWVNQLGKEVLNPRSTTGDYWELYREPSIRPWKPEEVPVGKTVRRKSTPHERLMILGVASNGKALVADFDHFGTPLDTLFRDFELTDGSPCGVEDAR